MRRRKNLCPEEQESIVAAYRVLNIPQKEVARRFRVTTQLVRDLIMEANDQPEKIRETKAKVKLVEKKKIAIATTIKLIQSEGRAIDSAI